MHMRMSLAKVSMCIADHWWKAGLVQETFLYMGIVQRVHLAVRMCQSSSTALLLLNVTITFTFGCSVCVKYFFR